VKKFAPLLVLYFSQGLPFGFQATALPLLLRERGASLQAIGFASLLAAPWLAKALWAPLVDRFGNDQFGRRKSWIVPMQAALTLCAVCAARTDDMRALAGLVLAMNFFAATQDIAVDALAVSWLEARDLGPANAIQVVGYKLGMLTGGGLLVWASARIGWSGLWNAMAALMFGVLLMSVVMREPPAMAGSGSGGAAAGLSFTEIGARLRAAFRHRATAALLAVVSTYKMGEVLADVMWKPMLFDRGFSAPQIGLWNGTFGMLFSLAGSSALGLLLRRVALSSALLWTAVARAVGVALLLWLSLMPQPSAAAVIAVTCVEHLAGGAITTVLFTLMMRHTDRQIGATHYTLLASVEVWGKLPLGAVSGVIAASIGYSGLFSVASGLCIAFVLLTAALRTRLAA
jgi:PAT family beta-lactamase induction signal transducer AmpG